MHQPSTPFWMKTTDEKGRTAHEEVLASAQRNIGLARTLTTKYLRDPSRAPEILEETVFRVSEFIQKCGLENIGNLNAYLIQSYENRLLEILEKESHLEHVGTLNDLISNVQTSPAAQGMMSYQDIETKIIVDDILAHLDDRSRRLIALKFYGYSYDTIGPQLGISPESARVQVSRLLTRLKNLTRKSNPRKVEQNARMGFERTGTTLPEGRERGASKDRPDLFEPIS